MQLTLDAIQQAEDHADHDWLYDAFNAVQQLAQHRATLSTDDVWKYLNDRSLTSTHEPRALGAIMRRAAKEKIIRKTGTYATSKRAECHNRPVMIWQSLTFQPSTFPF